MKKIGYGLLVALFLGVLALNRVNTYRERSEQEHAAVATTEQSTVVSAPVSAEQKTEKTYRVTFRVNPVVNASVKPQ